MNTFPARAAVIFVCLFAACPAHAKPTFGNIVKTAYELKDGSKVMTAGCNLCHTQAPTVNSYGKTLKAALAQVKAKELTAAILHATDKDDSDADGFTNATEIKADTLPADTASKPTGSPDAVKESGWLLQSSRRCGDVAAIAGHGNSGVAY
jgi:hypothetical protein